jgi:hypothetical protein
MRWAILGLTALALFAAGAVFQSRAPSTTEVPVIELRPVEDEPRPAKRPASAPNDKQSAGTRSRTDGGGGAAPAPAPAPAPAGGDDDPDDDDPDDDAGEDDGDDEGRDDD